MTLREHAPEQVETPAPTRQPAALSGAAAIGAASLFGGADSLGGAGFVNFHPVSVAAAGGPPLRRHNAGGASGDAGDAGGTGSAAADVLGGTDVDSGITATLRRRRGSGRPLPESMSQPLGEHFGQDLSTVRVHHDEEAGQLAGALQATAFTHGDDIYFAPGAYQPDDTGGQRILAHELSHVVAQRTGADRGGGGPLRVGAANDPAEAQADASADRAMSALRRSLAGPAKHEHARPVEHAPPAPELRRSVDDSPIRRLWGLDWLWDWGGSTATASAPTSSAAPAPGPAPTTGNVPTTPAPAPARAPKWWVTQLISAPGAALTAIIKERAAETNYEHGQLVPEDDDEGKTFVAEFTGKTTVGRQAGYKAESSGEIDDLSVALEAALEAFYKVGAESAAEQKLLVRLRALELEATGKSSLFAGIKAEFESSAEFGDGTLEAEVRGEIGAGISAQQEAEISLDIPIGEMSAEGKVIAEAIMAASGEGALNLDWKFEDIEATAKAEAFAGGRASAEGEVGYHLGGVKLFSMKGKASVSYGFGAGGGVSFAYKDGKLTVSSSAFASNFFGGGVETTGEVDLKEMTSLITGVIAGAYLKYAQWLRAETDADPRDPLANMSESERAQKIAYDTYIAPLRDQAASTAGSPPQKATTQRLLNRHRDKLGAAAQHSESDAGITAAIREAYGSRVQRVTVHEGRIGRWKTS